MRNEANPKKLNTIDQRLNTFGETKPIFSLGDFGGHQKYPLY